MGPTAPRGLEFDGDAPLPASSEPPAEGKWLVAPVRAKRPYRPFLAGGLGLLGYVAVHIVLGAHSLLAAMVALPFQIVWMAPFMGAGLRNAPRPEDLRLLEDSDDPDVCLVAVRIVTEGRTVGRDRGVAWFEDGRLLFSGHRTSFALGGEDVAPRGAWKAFRPTGAQELPDETVPLRAEGRKAVEVKPLSRMSDVGDRQEMRFLKALYAFKRNPPLAAGPRQWPPFEV